MEDCPDGRMDRAKMQNMFKSVIPEVTKVLFTHSLENLSACSGRGWGPVPGAALQDFRQGRGREHRLQGVHDRHRHDQQRRPGGEAQMGVQNVR